MNRSIMVIDMYYLQDNVFVVWYAYKIIDYGIHHINQNHRVITLSNANAMDSQVG